MNYEPTMMKTLWNITILIRRNLLKIYIYIFFRREQNYWTSCEIRKMAFDFCHYFKRRTV